MTRIPTPPLPDENECETKIVEVPVEVIKEVPVAVAPDPVMQLLTELRDNMFAMSQHLQANANTTTGKKCHRLPEIPDWEAEAEAEKQLTTTPIKTPTEPSSTQS